jgi:hypothetical protein
VYGSSKSGLDAFAQGLGDSLRGSGVHVLVVRPGFVHTKMTRDHPPAPLATTPERVAAEMPRWLPGIALGLVWVTHLIAYILASPNPHSRLALLASTGHDYLSYVGPVVVGGAIVSMTTFVLDRIRVARRPHPGRTATYGVLFRRLAVLQVLAFAGMEVSERLIHGEGMGTLVHPAVVIGVLLQPIAAFLAGRVLARADRIIELLVERLRRRRPTSSAPHGPTRPVRTRRLVPALDGWALRGPPLAR